MVALGVKGQFLAIIPQLDAVVSFTAIDMVEFEQAIFNSDTRMEVYILPALMGCTTRHCD